MLCRSDAQRPGPDGPGARLGQISRESTLAQDPHGPGSEFSQAKLLGLPVVQVIVAAAAAKARRQSHGLKAAGPIASSPVLALVDTALDPHERVAPMLLPVGAEPFKT